MVNLKEGNWIIKIQNDEELFKIQKIATGIDIRDYGRKTIHHIRIKNGKFGGWTDDLSWYQQQTKYENYNYINASELISEPQYHPITPKVGEEYRVLKELKGNVFLGNEFTLGRVYKVLRVDGTNIPLMLKGDKDDWWIKKQSVTSEYLELVEEPKEVRAATPSFKSWADYGAPMVQNPYLQEPINKSIIQKSMSFIKRLTQSADDKALLKARFTDDCGNLTSRGQEALTSLVFADKKTELVKLAEEVIAEEKE